MFLLAHWLCTFIPILIKSFLSFPPFQSCRFLEQPMNPTALSFQSWILFLFFLIQTLGSILLLFSSKSCPPIFILGSKVCINRTDSLGTVTVVFCILSRWYSSTQRCDGSTVALDGSLSWYVGRPNLLSFSECGHFREFFIPYPATLDIFGQFCWVWSHKIGVWSGI